MNTMMILPRGRTVVAENEVKTRRGRISVMRAASSEARRRTTLIMPL
jgi:hypothetical protein